MNLCYLALGSNLDSPERQLRRAIATLKKLPCSQLIQAAPIFHSKAWGRKSVPDYCNTVIELRTRLLPQQLLWHCHKIEHQSGRLRRVRWGARTLDIDILLYDDQTINTPTLSIPHPRMEQRDFVLVPLMEIAGGEFQIRGVKLSTLIERLTKAGP